MNDQFVHLHSHTLFSVLDGIASPRDYHEKATERGWPAVAITEHMNLASIPDSYFCQREFGTKAIFGVELYFNDYHFKLMELLKGGYKIRAARQSDDWQEVDLANRMARNRHLTVLCKNEQGYRNLLRIMQMAWEKGFYYRPRAWWDLLIGHREGLIILSGCLNGPISYELREYLQARQEYQATGERQWQQRAETHLRLAVQWHQKFRRTFGDDYYVELQMPGVPGDVDVFRKLVELAEADHCKMVVSNDSHYLVSADFEIQKLMMAIDQGTTVDDPNLFHVNSDRQFYKTRAELRKTFQDGGYMNVCDSSIFEQACDNTLEVADKVQPITFNSDPKLPQIEQDADKLRKLCAQMLYRKKLNHDKRYVDRLKLELKRIIEKGFASYFLITKDLIDYSRSIGYPTGPSRGSCGGCLIAYLLRITEIDPLRWGLSFDRFLSPSRGGIMLKVTMND